MEIFLFVRVVYSACCVRWDRIAVWEKKILQNYCEGTFTRSLATVVDLLVELGNPWHLPSTGCFTHRKAGIGFPCAITIYS